MIQKIPRHILEIVKQFEDLGFEIYFVGGCVRDMLLDRSIKDWDLTTNATPEQMQEIFPDAFYDNTFGTVGIPVKDVVDVEHLPTGRQGPQVVEVTTYRTEHGFSDKRHPEKVAWGKSIEEDLSRRDFTINTIALRLREKGRRSDLLQEIATLPSVARNDDAFEIIDPYNGQDDLKKKVIKAVGEPTQRFKEDALRLMRAIRFAAQLGFSIEDKTLQAIAEDAALLELISQERIRDELFKILASDFPYEGVMMLHNTHLLQYILPELLEGIGLSQKRPGRHHTEDVFTHNVLSLKFCPSTDPVVRFATLIHDVGKPRVAAQDKDGLIIFYNHEVAGATIAYKICERLKLSKKHRTQITKLIRWHMFTVDEHITDSAVRRFIRRIGVDNVSAMMDLRVGDRLGGGTQTAESWRLKLFKDRLEEQLAPAPFSINDLAIDGHDLIKELGMKPGREMGKVLQQLFEEVDEDLNLNTREFLLKRAKELAK